MRDLDTGKVPDCNIIIFKCWLKWFIRAVFPLPIRPHKHGRFDDLFSTSFHIDEVFVIGSRLQLFEESYGLSNPRLVLVALWNLLDCNVLVQLDLDPGQRPSTFCVVAFNIENYGATSGHFGVN